MNPRAAIIFFLIAAAVTLALLLPRGGEAQNRTAPVIAAEAGF